MDVSGLVEKTVIGLGYEFVDLERVGHGLMRVYIDKPDGVNVDDCATVSHQLTRLFAVEGVDYDRLEVSSPGLDRPLRKAADFARFSGREVRLRTRMPREGRRNFAGRILAVTGECLTLEVEGTNIEFELGDLDRARLVPEF